MSKVDTESAKLAIMELAEAFGAEESGVLALLPLAEAGRLFLRGDKAVYILAKSLHQENGTDLTEICLREPKAGDYKLYSAGMTVNVGRDGATAIDTVMMFTRTIKTVSKLAEQPLGIVEALAVRDIRILGEVCEALGFFE